jgi:Zinc finger, C3HC4 type (RING finger)
MNGFLGNTHIFVLSTLDIECLKTANVPDFKYQTKIVFNPIDFIDYRLDEDEICLHFLNGECNLINKCKKYHPAVIYDSECMICKANIQSSLRKFGLLSGCQDVFCYPCIRQWRSRGNVSSDIANSCPVCGIVSKELAPSYVFPLRFIEKLAVIQELLNKSQIDNI